MKNVVISTIALNGAKWNELFDNETELINAMYLCDTNENSCKCCKGYVYLESFKRYYKKNGSLSPKQLTQLKRLASTMYVHLKTVQKVESFYMLDGTLIVKAMN